MTDNSGLLQTLFNPRKEKDKGLGNHVPYLESQFFKFQVMGRTLDKPLKVSLSMSPLSNFVEYKTLTTSMNALLENTTAWYDVTTLFIAEGKWMAQWKVNEQSNVSECVGVVAASKLNRDELTSIPPAKCISDSISPVTIVANWVTWS